VSAASSGLRHAALAAHGREAFGITAENLGGFAPIAAGPLA